MGVDYQEMNTESRPPNLVIAAERLLLLSAAITVFFTVTTYAGLLSPKTSGMAVISNFTTAGLLVLCALKIGDGRNWARWLLLALFVLGSLVLPLAIIFAPQMLRATPTLFTVVGVIQFAIQTAALVLVFLPRSRPWFQPSTTQATA